MLQTGFRAMMGVKIYGSDLKEIERIGLQIEQLLKQVPGATDVVADRIVGKPYLEFEIDRDRIARYGVNIRDVQDVIEIAIGGMNLTESVEGRERYPIRVRYLREFREDIPELEKILVPTSTGAQVPIAQVVTIKSVLGPQEIKSESGLLVGYVTMNTRDRDEVSVVEDAEAALQGALRDGQLKLPAGYYWEWSGQFENQQRATARMRSSCRSTLVHHVRDALPGLQALVDRAHHLLRHPHVGRGRIHHARAGGARTCASPSGSASSPCSASPTTTASSSRPTSKASSTSSSLDSVQDDPRSRRASRARSASARA